MLVRTQILRAGMDAMRPIATRAGALHLPDAVEMKQQHVVITIAAAGCRCTTRPRLSKKAGGSFQTLIGIFHGPLPLLDPTMTEPTCWQ